MWPGPAPEEALAESARLPDAPPATLAGESRRAVAPGGSVYTRY